MRLVQVLAAVVATCGLVAGCGGSASGAAVVSPGAVAVVAPAGPTVSDQLQFTAQTVDGREFSGQSLVGKPSVLWFWAPWCTTCQAEAPGVARVARAHPAVTFVGVAAQDQVPAMRGFVAKYGLSFTHLADLDASVWRRFGVTVQPAFAFVKPDGSVEVVKQALSEQQLSARLAGLGG
ncbi:MAG: protein disulfide oxidoreductase [Pseudonocardiales bacterium]|nr:protein disulfide oxidoreductase [Pseudonocardiales bacterium]